MSSRFAATAVGQWWLLGGLGKRARTIDLSRQNSALTGEGEGSEYLLF